jgi:hypothetical protein
MFKFIFTRTRAPTTATWNTTTPVADWASAGMATGMAGACRSLWHWLGGDLASGPQYRSGSQDAQDQADVQAMSAILTAEHVPGDESARQAAAYGLARLAASHSRDAAAAVPPPCSICGIDAWIFYIDTVQHGHFKRDLLYGSGAKPSRRAHPSAARRSEESSGLRVGGRGGHRCAWASGAASADTSEQRRARSADAHVCSRCPGRSCNKRAPLVASAQRSGGQTASARRGGCVVLRETAGAHTLSLSQYISHTSPFS